MKCAVSLQIKPEILKLTIRSKLSIASIFVSCEERGYYCVVSVGQLSFDCRLHSESSCRMQDPGLA